jgi:hypothetical protein
MNPKRPRPFRSGPVFGAVLLVFAGVASGCDSSSGGGGHGPADNFVGRWALDPDSGPYTMSGCADPTLNGDWVIWDELAFDYGELSDLMEVSGNCGAVAESGDSASSLPGLAYDVSGDTATATSTNPFSGKAPFCLTTLGTDGLGNPVGLQLTPKPESWQFALTAKAGGEPRRAEYGVKTGGEAAKAELVSLDVDGNLVVLDTCSMTGRATFFRITTN